MRDRLLLQFKKNKGANKMTKTQDLVIDLVLNDHNIYTLKTNEYDQEWNLNMKMLSDWGNNLNG